MEKTRPVLLTLNIKRTKNLPRAIYADFNVNCQHPDIWWLFGA